MNIYEKLQSMRVKLQGMSLKKSGKNKFAGYDYFELVDFLPAITKMMLDNKVVSSLTMSESIAQLTLVNIEEPAETIVFSAPMASASLKGCHDIQNLGAVITYLRRYLYINAFDIMENDALDGGTSHVANTKPTTHKQYKVCDASSADIKCSKCGAPMYLSKKKDKNGNDYYYCSKYKDGCSNLHYPSQVIKNEAVKNPEPENAPPVDAYDDVPF